MNINKLIEGQRHDEDQIEEIVLQWLDDKSMIWESKMAMKQYAEHYLIKFLDSEIERLETLKHNNPLLGTSAEVERVMEAANLTIADQITHLQDIKKQLK